MIFLAGIALLLGSANLEEGNSWRPILRSIGSFLSATILLGFLYRALLRDYDDAKSRNVLASLLDDKIDRVVSGAVQYGFHGFQDRIKFDELFDSLSHGQTIWWLDTYDPHHRAWHDSLLKAIKGGAKAKFLVLHPDSQIAHLRAQELGEHFQDGRFHDELEGFIKSLRLCQEEAKKGNAPGSLEIRLYDELPCAPIYVIAEGEVPVRAYSSLFLGRPTAVDFPHLHWGRADKNFIEDLFQYLREKWKRNEGSDLGSDAASNVAP